MQETQGTQVDPWVGRIPWRRKWHPTPVFLPGKFHQQRSLEGYGPWDLKKSDMTEQLHTHLHTSETLVPDFSVRYVYFLSCKDNLKLGLVRAGVEALEVTKGTNVFCLYSFTFRALLPSQGHSVVIR